MRGFVFTVFLFFSAGCDWRTKKIPVWMFKAFGWVGMVFVFWRFWERADSLQREGASAAAFLTMLFTVGLAVFPGGLLLFLSRVAKGAIGAGDGWFFLIAALYLSGAEVWILFLGGLLCSGFGSLYVLGRELSRGRSARKSSLAFLPFLIPVWLGMLFLKAGS